MSNSTLTLLVGAVLAVLVAAAVWRLSRRASGDYLQDESVSRQWLLEHQGEDHR
jgi:predicted membrane-bound mannosyltransferase